jgi:hypothetical protein
MRIDLLIGVQRMTRRKPDILTLSSDGLCLSITGIERMKRIPAIELELHTPYGKKRKKFCVAQVHDKKWGGKDYLIDRITGTLYDTQTGECLTTPQLRVLNIP